MTASYMSTASYRIVGSGQSWSVDRGGNREGAYATKEAAFEAAVAAASNAIKDGLGVSIDVPPPVGDQPATGGAP